MHENSDIRAISTFNCPMMPIVVTVGEENRAINNLTSWSRILHLVFK
jgi:hypothetical protein